MNQPVLAFIIGITLGIILETAYRSVNAKRFVVPELINIQMYGLMGIFLVLLRQWNLLVPFELFLLFSVPTLIEYTTGYIGLKLSNKYFWDYQNESLNFQGLICLRFSTVWFILSALFYYLLLPYIGIKL